jgi:hypothetical protein
MSAIFVYAIALGIGESDPAAIVKGAMAPMIKSQQPAVTDFAGPARCWRASKRYRPIRQPNWRTGCWR